MSKKYIILNIFLILINSIQSSVIVKAEGKNDISCQDDMLHISIQVSFSEKPKKNYYPFILTLDSPEDLQLKCMLEYQEGKIDCVHAFFNELDYIEKGDQFRFPIYFPEIEDIKWDYQTFLNEVFRRVYNSSFECGNPEKDEKNEESDYRSWDIKGKLLNIDRGFCQPASMNENNHRYYFEITANFDKGEILKDLDTDIYLLQDIWVPLVAEKKIFEDLTSSYAFCGSTEPINKNSISNFKLSCYISIDIDSVYNNDILVDSFYDEVHIQQGDKVSKISINIDTKDFIEAYEENEEEEENIICPDLPFFTVDSKNSILMGDYNESDTFSLFIVGTLTNGYYTFKNGTRVALAQTYKDIKFDLIVQDNFLDSEDKDVSINCVLRSGTLYEEDEEAVIRCTGKRIDNNNVDIVLNWNIKENNNFKGIIIKWPKSDIKRKNIYGYDLNGISIRQSDYGCHSNNFEFYLYIYDLGREPKISFELPLSSPKDTSANCKLFDSTALKCSIDLKHKKISKGTKITLPEGEMLHVIETLEGNKINFQLNNYTEINNEKDLTIKTQESCGDYLVVGTFKDLGMSHKVSVAFFIIIIIFICLFIIGSGLYILYKCKQSHEMRKKLTSNEESKNNASVVKK